VAFGPVTTVRAGRLDLLSSRDAGGVAVDAAPAGMAFPLDAIAYDPATYAAFVPAAERALVEGLGAGEALLGRTSARLRRLGPGGTLALAGGTGVRIAGVVDDTTIGGAEVALTVAGAAPLAAGSPAFGTERYLLVRHHQVRAEAESTIRGLVPAGTAVRIRAPGETPFLHHGDAVLPQAVIKDRFGEFAYRRGAPDDRAIVQEPAWEAENIVAATVPLLGRVRCHRSLVPALRGALTEAESRGLGGLLPLTGSDGCWNARLTGPEGELSRHGWGAALDLNSAKNPTGLDSVQDPRLIEIMERWGFTWGGRWLVPDPAHFEYVRPPAP
jgi:hypothetical protein